MVFARWRIIALMKLRPKVNMSSFFKERARIAFFLVGVVLFIPNPAAGQSGYATVSGTATDEKGHPYVGAIVRFRAHQAGVVTDAVTDKLGHYSATGFPADAYDVSLIVNGKEEWTKKNFQMFLWNRQLADGQSKGSDRSSKWEEGRGTLDFNMKEIRKKSPRPGPTDAQTKEMEDTLSYNRRMDELNAMVVRANSALNGERYAAAVVWMQKATELGPEFARTWGGLGIACLDEAKQLPRSADAGTRDQLYARAIQSFEKALSMAQSSSADSQDTSHVPEYYEGLAEAQARTGEFAAAEPNYRTAAKLDPPHAGAYLFDLGLQLVNLNRYDEALPVMEQVIAADPTIADAYFYKGTVLVKEAKLISGKLIAPNGTAEAFQKYLALKPQGAMADMAQDSLL